MLMKKNPMIVVLFILSSIAISAKVDLGQAYSPGRLGQIESATGAAKATGESLVPLNTGDVLMPGDQVIVRPAGHVMVDCSTSSPVEITEPVSTFRCPGGVVTAVEGNPVVDGRSVTVGSLIDEGAWISFAGGGRITVDCDLIDNDVVVDSQGPFHCNYVEGLLDVTDNLQAELVEFGFPEGAIPTGSIPTPVCGTCFEYSDFLVYDEEGWHLPQPLEGLEMPVLEIRLTDDELPIIVPFGADGATPNMNDFLNDDTAYEFKWSEGAPGQSEQNTDNWMGAIIRPEAIEFSED